MKASDYIVSYLIEKGITDVFGYPGGMVTHLMDSFQKKESEIRAHVTYHEQGAAFAACGYAQSTGKVGVAYATSGPGATNLITGICNAFFDSTPTLFITGQVNTFESKGDRNVRQRGFQETDIVSMVKPVTKYAAYVPDAASLRWYLDRAFYEAQSGRKGPVLLDIPMNVFRGDVDPAGLEGFVPGAEENLPDVTALLGALRDAKRPVVLAGNGVKVAGAEPLLSAFLDKTGIPVVTSMPAFDAAGRKSYGFIGAYGSRTANFIVAKSDLVIALGARMDVRQVGAKRENFAPDARLVRVDIDAGELSYKVHEDEIAIEGDCAKVLEALLAASIRPASEEWIGICELLKEVLEGEDVRRPNSLMKKLGFVVPKGAVITTDVGQNQVWAAQSLPVENENRVFFSGGHGAMGYSLPAAIGCALGSCEKVVSISGDGGLQMNIQELQTIVREQLPVKVVLFNNAALGMIRHFQEMYFDSVFFQTTPEYGYTVPDFAAIAAAYGLPYTRVEKEEDIDADLFCGDGPAFVEVRIAEPTYVFPKLEFGKPNQDQEPLLDRTLFALLMELDEENLEEVRRKIHTDRQD